MTIMCAAVAKRKSLSEY